MRQPTAKQKPRRALVTSFPAPTGGLVSNRNLAMARGPDVPPGAAVLENFMPTATGVVLRRGTVRKATLPDNKPVRSIFTYTSGAQKELFAATDDGIWNITTVESPNSWGLVDQDGDYMSPDPAQEQVFGQESVYQLDVLTGQSSGDWSVVQFATAGGEFLVGVNGVDDAFLYDGTDFTSTSITFPAGSSLTTADLSYVWVYKQRIWFIEKDSLNAWYLPVDQVGGELTLWPMGGVFVMGGSLVWGQTWSLDAGGSGGLSEQCVFTTTEGQVAAYQGLSPDVDQGWQKVGVYRIGKPMGKHGFILAGGDIVIATTVGLISLAESSRSDYAALGQGAVSYPIEDEWVRMVRERGQQDWRCEVWADGQMVVISPPHSGDADPFVFVVNANTGKWAKFTGWSVRSMAVFQDGLYYGRGDGAVCQAWVGGTDEGLPYVGRMLPLFDDLDAPASLKVAKMARVITRSRHPARGQLSGHVNYRVNFPAAPNPHAVVSGNEWDTGTWGSSIWDATGAEIVSSDWVSVSGAGHDLAIGAQFTSGSIVPLDVELVRIDLTYSLAEIGT